MTGIGNLVKTIEIKDRQGRIIATEDVVTYAGLLSLAHDQGLKKIETTLVQMPDQSNSQTAVFLAIIETERGSFKGHGDANPDNVASLGDLDADLLSKEVWRKPGDKGLISLHPSVELTERRTSDAVLS